MSRRLQFSLAIILAGIPICVFFGWSCGGTTFSAIFAAAAYVVLAPIFARTIYVAHRQQPVTIERATRSGELRLLPVYFVEITILVFFGVFFICGSTIAEMVLGFLSLAIALLKLAAHVYIYRKIPPAPA